jgi:SdrD B-like domain
VLNIAYAAQLTPDAIRGTGVNVASVFGQRADNGQRVQDGPATHKLRVRSGLLSDCGTIIGRVFNDKNFDGEQQPGEPGIPNAVIILDDGNRITTDKDGLYSVANVVAGQRTGVLDATSVRGYTLAPNKLVRERNSQSRLVNLAPGSLVRMNFAVTPAAKEEKPCNCN